MFLFLFLVGSSVFLIGMGVCSQSWRDLINVSLKPKMRMRYITNLLQTENILEEILLTSFIEKKHL